MNRIIRFSILVFTLCFAVKLIIAQPNIRATRQGYSMSLAFDNRGSAGNVAYSGVIPRPDNLPGLEYPVGSEIEHLFGMGIWIGGILDTSTGPTPSLVQAVTVGYEGWQGPHFEFYPGSSPADSIWMVNGRGVPRPLDWNAYWGNLIPQISFSDNDRYCLYDDSHVLVQRHTPLKLKVAQSSFVWSDSYAEAVHILEYRIVNTGVRRIDSAYVGVFIDPVPNLPIFEYYYFRYDQNIRTAYSYRGLSSASTLIGAVALDASRPLSVLRHSIRFWSGQSHPNTDSAKYRLLSSGITDSNQSIPNGAQPRYLVSLGPFTLRPASDLLPDTIVAVFGIVCAQDTISLRQHAIHARNIYENGGAVAVQEISEEAPSRFKMFQNYPNPFNPITTIKFRLPEASWVNFSIFNALGEEVATLVNRELSPGEHICEWDGVGQPSGVYFCRLRAGEYLETKKLILLR